MTDSQRQEIIATLVLWTNWNKSAFENLSDKELLKMYDRHCSRFA